MIELLRVIITSNLPTSPKTVAAIFKVMNGLMVRSLLGDHACASEVEAGSLVIFSSSIHL